MIVSTLIIDYGMYAVLYLSNNDNGQKTIKIIRFKYVIYIYRMDLSRFSMIAYIPIKIYEKYKIKLPDRLRYIYRVFYHYTYY